MGNKREQAKNLNYKDVAQADEISKLAIKYRHSTNERERNKLFMQIAAKYMPKIKSWLQNVAYQDHSEFTQIYYTEVVVALNKWSMKSSFATYLYPYVISVMRKYMGNLKTLKKGMVCVSLDSLELDIDSDDDTWDTIYNDGNNYIDDKLT